MKLRPFELVLVIIFIVLAVTALIMLANAKGGGGKDGDTATGIGVVSIWGTIPEEAMTKTLREVMEDNEAYRNVSYRYYSPEEFDLKLLNALADGAGPDLVLMSHEKLVEMRNRIQPISYETFSIRDIRDRYVDGAEIFALSDGFYGFPVATDPLVMYWNRDVLATEGYLDAPKTWETLVNNMFPEIIVRDFDRTIRRSVVAMGEYANVRNGFGVISMLLFQAGTNGVLENDDKEYKVSLHTSNDGVNPLRITADFYTRFSKPANSLYSWNRSFNEDRSQFVSEDLAFYFGYGSEGRVIEKINPNLNFDVAEVPQGASATVRRTYGKFYALSLMKSSDNQSGAYKVMVDLGGKNLSKRIADLSNMAPAYSSLVSAGSQDTYGRINYMSAGIAQGWLNPDLSKTDLIFDTMTKDINENRRLLTEASNDAVKRLSDEY